MLLPRRGGGGLRLLLRALSRRGLGERANAQRRRDEHEEQSRHGKMSVGPKASRIKATSQPDEEIRSEPRDRFGEVRMALRARVIKEPDVFLHPRRLGVKLDQAAGLEVVVDGERV